ncbi:MAG: flagellar biosynthesis protein FliQ [Deltaproteobacteria bacterium]|nr:flagellar biosynthesis protein FliQ [Deltaproteobacteria bacterium]
MTIEQVIQISQLAIDTALVVSTPVLVAGLIAGLLISVFQAVTQIQEMTLTFIPKIIAVGIAAAIFFNMMMNALLDFTVQMLTTFPDYIR